MADKGMTYEELVQDEDQEWFGEGSAFDSGEELAAALFAIRSLVPNSAVAQTATAAKDSKSAEPEYVTLAKPAVKPSGSPGWNIVPQGVGDRSRWGIRHSVQLLRSTEEALTRLRNEAVELSWRMASIAIIEGQPRRHRRAGRRV